MQPPLLIGIGEVLWDLLPAGRQLGGAPANFAYHANALGGRGVMISRVGDDPLGREIFQRLDALGVDRQFVGVDPAHPTGAVDIRLDARGVPDYVIRPDVAWDHLEAGPAMIDLAAQASGVCFGSLGQRSPGSREAIQAFLGATSSSCMRIFDINLRQNYFSRQLIEESLRLASVFRLNDQELPIVAELLGISGDQPTVVREIIGRFSLSLVALTRGSAGSSLYAGNGYVVDQPAIAVNVVDTVGAGDAFTAALVLGLFAGMTLAGIGQRAAQIAACVCSRHGATPAMPESLRILSR